MSHTWRRCESKNNRDMNGAVCRARHEETAYRAQLLYPWQCQIKKYTSATSFSARPFKMQTINSSPLQLKLLF